MEHFEKVSNTENIINEYLKTKLVITMFTFPTEIYKYISSKKKQKKKKERTFQTSMEQQHIIIQLYYKIHVELKNITNIQY